MHILVVPVSGFKTFSMSKHHISWTANRYSIKFMRLFLLWINKSQIVSEWLPGSAKFFSSFPRWNITKLLNFAKTTKSKYEFWFASLAEKTLNNYDPVKMYRDAWQIVLGPAQARIIQLCPQFGAWAVVSSCIAFILLSAFGRCFD